VFALVKPRKGCPRLRHLVIRATCLCLCSWLTAKFPPLPPHRVAHTFLHTRAWPLMEPHGLFSFFVFPPPFDGGRPCGILLRLAQALPYSPPSCKNFCSLLAVRQCSCCPPAGGSVSDLLCPNPCPFGTCCLLPPCLLGRFYL